jgi:high affinity sulfate transporter 1
MGSLLPMGFPSEGEVASGTAESTSGVARFVPALATVRSYRRAWFQKDLVAALVLTAVLVPQGVAYAELAGLPAETGLYATILPLAAYALFGPSRILVLSPDSALAPLVAAAVIPLAGEDMAHRIELAALLALMVGGLLLVGGFVGLGFLTDLVSKPVRVGYLSGIAALVIIEQVPTLLGFSIAGGNVLEDVRAIAQGLDGAAFVSAAIGIGCLASILVARRVSPLVPGVLIAVVGATVAVSVFDLSVAVVGTLPSGLPSLSVPTASAEEIARLSFSAVAVALLAFGDTSVLSRSYASRVGQRVDQNQELRALGISNAATGLFSGFPISASSSRTPVAEAAGSKTQLTGLLAAAGVGVVLLVGTNLLSDMPKPALAAVIISAVVRLIDIKALRWLFRVNKRDWALAVAAFLGVVAFGILAGVAIAIGLSILGVLERAWHPYNAVLSRVDGMKGYHDVARHPEGRQIPGLLLVRFDAPLFFANAEIFRETVEAAVARHGTPERVVVAGEPITDIDSTAAEVLADLLDDLEAAGIEFGFAELKGPVKDKLRTYGLFDRIGEGRFYTTLGLAVRAHVAEHEVDWTDWEDE